MLEEKGFSKICPSWFSVSGEETLEMLLLSCCEVASLLKSLLHTPRLKVPLVYCVVTMQFITRDILDDMKRHVRNIETRAEAYDWLYNQYVQLCKEATSSKEELEASWDEPYQLRRDRKVVQNECKHWKATLKDHADLMNLHQHSIEKGPYPKPSNNLSS